MSETDSELVRAYRKHGNKEIISELFNRHSLFVLAICMKYVKDKFLAEEITVEIFESLFKKLKKQNTDYFKTWLYSLTKNHCLMYLRKQGTLVKNKEKIKNNDADFMDSDYEMNLNNEGEEKKRLLDEAMNELKPEQKKCIELFYFEEKSYNEIVKLTGYSIKKVKSYLQNGKRNLKLKLSDSNE